MTLSASIGGSGPSAVFNGFNQSVPTAATSNGITLTPSVSDTYSASGNGFNGFYLQSSNTIALSPTASPNQYTLSVSQSTGGSASYLFYFDTIQVANPTVSSTAFSFTSNPSSVQISGVYIVYGTPTYTLTTTASNIGNYFYRSPYLNYTNKLNGTTLQTYNEAAITNVTSGITAGQITGPITATNTSILSVSLASRYGNSIQFSTNANNFFGSSTAANATSIPSIVDGPSYTLVYTTLAQTLRTLTSGTLATGFWVSSGTVNPSNILLVPDITNGVIYANTAYDNTASIVSSQELQVSNGAFTTPGAQSYSYLNYSTYYYTNTLLNTVNYTSPSNYNGYRFTTFAWRLSAATYSTLSFKMNGTSTQLSNVNSVACIGTTPILLYYRFEDANQAAPTGPANISSAWLNGNSITGTPTTSGNYFLSNTNYWANLGLSITSTATTFTVFCLNNTISTQTVNLYCRVGLPMSSSISFSTITALIST
jgi:hypothetical protein